MANVTKEVQKANNLPVPSTTPVSLLEKAIEAGADIDKLKELMDLQERWEKKEARKSFFEALARFQSLVPSIPKSKVARINSQKGNYSYKFADLGTIAKTIKPAMQQCGLSYRWEFQETNAKLRVTCFISHQDGHTETSSMEAGMDSSGFKNDIQQKGSTQTYLQRYTLIGGLGISTADEDNDGRGHKTTEPQPEQTEEDFLDQWEQAINQTSRQAELTTLYIKNKKTVEGSEKLKSMFKDREKFFKSTKPATEQTLNMP